MVKPCFILKQIIISNICILDTIHFKLEVEEHCDRNNQVILVLYILYLQNNLKRYALLQKKERKLIIYLTHIILFVLKYTIYTTSYNLKLNALLLNMNVLIS